MKRSFVIWVLALVGIVLPTHALAGTPYSINWLLTSENTECVTAEIVEGTPFFNVNGTPLPTYSVSGAYTFHPNGFESNLATAGFDSVLLRMGTNDISFRVNTLGGNDWCTHESNVVTLNSPELGIEKLLFNVRRDGTAFSDSTKLDLKLEEINPQLAQDIAFLEAEIAEERKWLVKNAKEIVDLDKRLDALQALETELGDLLKRPLDEITAEDLDEILNRYSSVVDDATRAALQLVLADFKKSLDDLQTELADLMANFSDQADSVADLITGDARANGFTPDDPSNYSLGPNDVPWPEIPDISNIEGAFDPANDPYAAYADGVIASLDENVSGAIVVGRANFVATVRAWKSNQAALQQAIQARMGVSLAETNAFLNAQNKVTDYLRRFMNGSGWFHDAPIPEDVRAEVDGPLKAMYGALAEDLKDRLNAWEVAHSPPEANLFFDTLRAFSAGMQAADELVEEYRGTMRTFVHAATRVGIGFVPFVGPALDLCEAVTGREWCTPTGRQLTTGERVWSAAGFGVGKLVRVWRRVAKSGISAEGKLAAEGIVALGDEFAEMVATARGRRFKTLSGAVGTQKVNDFEKLAARYLVKDQGHKMLGVGDDGVRIVLDISDASRACDYLTISKKGGLILSEAKQITSTTGQVNTPKALEQLNNAVDALKKKNYLDAIERVQIITTKPARFKGGFTWKDGKLYNTNTKQFESPVGRPDLIVHVVEL